MLAQQNAIQEDSRAVGRFVHFQQRDGGHLSFDLKRAPVPKRFALWAFLPDLRERRPGFIDQARHRHAALEPPRHRGHASLCDLPLAIEGDDGAVAEGRRKARAKR